MRKNQPEQEAVSLEEYEKSMGLVTLISNRKKDDPKGELGSDLQALEEAPRNVPRKSP